MDNYEIADQLSMLAKLMDIHGENSFKSKSYSSAAFALEKLPQNLATMPADKIFSIKGIGESVGKKIVELLEAGEIKALKEYLSKTPQGVLDMMHIKGLGPKKIHTLWKELGIDTIEELKEACAENRIAAKKGFGEKTQQKILEEISFQQNNEGKLLYVQAESFAEAFTLKLKESFPDYVTELCGDYRRQLEIVEKLEWVTTVPINDLKKFLSKASFELLSESDEALTVSAEGTIALHFYSTTADQFHWRCFEHNCSPEFLLAWQGGHTEQAIHFTSEEEIFKKAGLPLIPAYRREKAAVLDEARKPHSFENIVQTNSVKGLIHSHSNWSDGAHTIEQMANELIRLGFEYLVISDHSKAAYYANGLTEQRIREQHAYIDELNKKLHPFKIFKSIECDILSDGAMDYSNSVLSSFDLVIASIHSNLTMEEEKAMKRLLGAITNPHVTILGHMTGRLLLRRRGYPVDHKTIIDACAAHHVVIEINANPARLDMDWRWIDYALEKGVLLSINPDAHTIDEFQNIKYGVAVAQKGGLTADRNLSSMHLSEFENYLQTRKKIKGID